MLFFIHIEIKVAAFQTGKDMTSDILNAFDWPLSPFCNSSMNNNPVTLNKDVWTVKNAFYGKQLFGYVYDNLDVGGHSWHGIAADIKAKQVDDHNGLKLPFVSFSAPALGVISSKTTLGTFSYCCLPKNLN